MRKAIWASLSAALVASAASAQSMSVPGPIKAREPIPQHPGLMAVPAGSKFCFVTGHLAPGDCPPPPPAQACLIGAQRCSNPSKSAGGMVPL